MSLFSNDVVLGYRSGAPRVLPKELRNRHVLSIGPTGVGKSKQLESVIRQDLLAWPQTRCGLALWDPHGTCVDNLLAFCAEQGLDALPIIPFDCRRLDWITCFNPLRARPGMDPATIASGCMDVIINSRNEHADGMPRLEKWMRAGLLTVLHSNGTVGDILAVLRSPDIRRSITRAAEDDVARSAWQSASSLKESEFQTAVESLVNRVVRFVSTAMLRLSLNQTVSLDFGSILEKGHVVLISLATAGGTIDDIDARTMGGLLLQDLWASARVRGKGESGQKRSFRVFVDEFSRFLTPSLSESMAESRGFGLELFFCCQSTTALRATPAGQQILNSVLANVHTKIVYNTQHPEDLELLTPMLYRNEVDPDQIKFQPYGTKTLGHEIKYMQSKSASRTRGTADSRNWSFTENASRTTGTSYMHSETTGISHGTQRNVSAGRNTTLSVGSGHSSAESTAESEAEGTTESRATGQARQRSESKSEARHLDSNYDDMMKIVSSDKRKRIATFDEAYTDNKYEDYRSFNRTIDKTASEGESESDSESSSLATTRSTSSARARQDGESHSQALSLGASEAFSEGETESESFQTSDSETESESTSVGSARTQGIGHTDSNSKSEGVTNAPMLMPILGQEALPPQFRSPDEQLFICSQSLSSLPDRHAIVRIGTTPPVEIVTPSIAPAAMSAKGARAWATLKLKKLPFALTFDEATRRLAERRRLFEAKYLGSASTGEPTSIVRRIKES